MEHPSFEYTYSARRQQEVEEIRKAYLPKEQDKLTELRRLHAIPTRKARSVSISLGVAGALILGTGMSLCLTEMGAALGRLSMPAGILVGLTGMVLMGLSWPLYSRTLKAEREKIAPEILKLSDELLK